MHKIPVVGGTKQMESESIISNITVCALNTTIDQKQYTLAVEVLKA